MNHSPATRKRGSAFGRLGALNGGNSSFSMAPLSFGTADELPGGPSLRCKILITVSSNPTGREDIDLCHVIGQAPSPEKVRSAVRMLWNWKSGVVDHCEGAKASPWILSLGFESTLALATR